MIFLTILRVATGFGLALSVGALWEGHIGSGAALYVVSGLVFSAIDGARPWDQTPPYTERVGLLWFAVASVWPFRLAFSFFDWRKRVTSPARYWVMAARSGENYSYFATWKAVGCVPNVV